MKARVYEKLHRFRWSEANEEIVELDQLKSKVIGAKCSDANEELTSEHQDRVPGESTNGLAIGRIDGLPRSESSRDELAER